MNRLTWLGSVRAPLAGAALLAFGLGLAGCAPRSTRTHFERWNAQEAQMKAEAEAEDAAEAAEAAAAEAEPGGAPKTAAAAPKQPAAAPPPPAPAGYNSLGGTPAIPTSTRSRVVSPPPPPPEEDVIY